MLMFTEGVWGGSSRQRTSQGGEYIRPSCPPQQGVWGKVPPGTNYGFHKPILLRKENKHFFIHIRRRKYNAYKKF